MKFARARTQPSRDLVSRVESATPAPKILDIGCGAGNSTRVLKNKFPSADILGIDSSADMIENARKANPDIGFRLRAISPSCAEISGFYDIIFSNACLQWVGNHKLLFPSLFSKLSPRGTLAVQIPLTEDMPINKILDALKSEKNGFGFSGSVHDLHSLKVEEYYDIVSTLTEDFDIWQTAYLQIFDGLDGIINWYVGSRLRPFLANLTEKMRPNFLSRIKTELDNYYSERPDGKIILPFPRLFIVARKVE